MMARAVDHVRQEERQVADDEHGKQDAEHLDRSPTTIRTVQVPPRATRCGGAVATEAEVARREAFLLAWSFHCHLGRLQLLHSNVNVGAGGRWCDVSRRRPVVGVMHHQEV